MRIFENKQKTNCTYLKEVDVRLTEEYRKSSDKWNETMVEMKDHLLEIHKRNRGIELNSKYNVWLTIHRSLTRLENTVVVTNLTFFFLVIDIELRDTPLLEDSFETESMFED